MTSPYEIEKEWFIRNLTLDDSSTGKIELTIKSSNLSLEIEYCAMSNHWAEAALSVNKTHMRHCISINLNGKLVKVSALLEKTLKVFIEEGVLVGDTSIKLSVE